MGPERVVGKKNGRKSLELLSLLCVPGCGESHDHHAVLPALGGPRPQVERHIVPVNEPEGLGAVVVQRVQREGGPRGRVDWFPVDDILEAHHQLDGGEDEEAPPQVPLPKLFIHG